LTPQEELDYIDLAIRRILEAGQSFSLSTQNGAGSSRQTTFADLNQLYVRKAQLETKLGLNCPVRIGVGF